VSGYLSGEINRIVIGDGGLASAGSPVFNADGKAVGLVNSQPPFPMFLNDRESLMALISPPKFMISTSDFDLALNEPPTVGRPAPLGWAGLPELFALRKDEAEQLGLQTQAAVRIGTIIADSPSEKAGLKRDDIIVRLNGESLQFGGNPQDVPLILQRKLLCFKPGTIVKLSTFIAKDQPNKDVELTLAPQPKLANEANRYWSKDFGFGVREMVPLDAYAQNLKPNANGLIVTAVKPGSAAAVGRLRSNDVVIQLNGQPVKNLEIFESTLDDFRRANPNTAVGLVVLRSGHEETISCEPPR